MKTKSKKSAKSLPPEQFKKIFEVTSSAGRSYFVVISHIASVAILSHVDDRVTIEIGLTSGKRLLLPTNEPTVQGLLEMMDDQ